MKVESENKNGIIRSKPAVSNYQVQTCRRKIGLLSEKMRISRTTKGLLITSFVLLGALLAGPLLASNSNFDARGTTMCIPAGAPVHHIVTSLIENQIVSTCYTGLGSHA